MKVRTKKMAIRDNREYRNIKLELRAAENGSEENYTVEGYASTFEPYVMFEMDGIQYKEQIDPQAFEECDMSDVIFCKDHEGTVFARTRNNTLELSVDDKGLFTRTDLSKTSSARAMFEEIQTGMYDQMSFAFTVREDSYDRDTHTRTILRINKLYDVSAVSFPANPGTDIGVATRDYFNGVIEAERAERLAKEEAMKEIKARYWAERKQS